MKALQSVYSIYLARYLIYEKHHWLVSARGCEENSKKVIFRFQQTPELMQDIEEYMTMTMEEKTQF